MQQAHPFESFVIKSKEHNIKCFEVYKATKERYNMKEKTFNQLIELSWSKKSPFDEEALKAIKNRNHYISLAILSSNIVQGDITPETEFTFSFTGYESFGKVVIKHSEFLKWFPNAELYRVRTQIPSAYYHVTMVI